MTKRVLLARYLGKLLVQKGILLAVCTENYAEVTSSKYSSFEELKLAYDRNLDVIPLKVTQAYPPSPPHGPQHPFDKEGQAIGLLAMAMPTSKVYLDCLTKTGDLLSPHDIAARIAEKLREGTAKAGEGSQGSGFRIQFRKPGFRNRGFRKLPDSTQRSHLCLRAQ